MQTEGVAVIDHHAAVRAENAAEILRRIAVIRIVLRRGGISEAALNFRHQIIHHKREDSRYDLQQRDNNYRNHRTLCAVFLRLILDGTRLALRRFRRAAVRNGRVIVGIGFTRLAVPFRRGSRHAALAARACAAHRTYAFLIVKMDTTVLTFHRTHLPFTILIIPEIRPDSKQKSTPFGVLLLFIQGLIYAPESSVSQGNTPRRR